MITVFTGPMYANKSGKLIDAYIDRMKVLENEGENVIAFKPSKDTREFSRIYSRARNVEVPAIVIESLDEIPKYIKDIHDTILIDEAQFLKGSTDTLINLSVLKEIDIYISGLNMNSELRSFGIMNDILSVADNIEILKARCDDCNSLNATYTWCDIKERGEILIGNSMYHPLCSKCLKERLLK